MRKPKRSANGKAQPHSTPVESFLALSDEEKDRAVAIYNVENWDSDPGPLTAEILRELADGKDKWAAGGGPIVFPVILDNQMLAQLDDMADRMGVTRSDLIAEGIRKTLAGSRRHATPVTRR